MEGIIRNAVLDALFWVLHILSTGRQKVRLAGVCRAAGSLTSRVYRWPLVRKLRS